MPKRASDSARDPLTPYAGRWVALLRGSVVGQGGTPEQALHAARETRFKEKPQVIYVPTIEPLSFSPLLKQIAQSLPPDVPAYLVGGAVRDALLGRATRDLDFVLPGAVLRVARRLADNIGAAFFPLDAERDTARLILKEDGGERQILDFAALRGPDLESDLGARDFTINAIAADVRDPQKLLDPTGGAADLFAKRLRHCSTTSLSDDPVRILRAIRLAADYHLSIVPETRALMRQAVPLLSNVSVERARDELFRILEGQQPSAALRALDILGGLSYILPELPVLKGIEQTPPHVSDVWNHTLGVVKKLESALEVLAPEYDPDKAANLLMGWIVLRLGRYRHQVQAHMQSCLNINRSPRALLFLAALYHDVGKSHTRQIDDRGRARFFEHAKVGARIAADRARSLRLSNAETDRLKVVVHHHMRPLLLAQLEHAPSRRAIYRFFRDTGQAGVDICLLSLADTLATYETTLPQDLWGKHLDVVRTLLEAWWENPGESIFPPNLISGSEVIEKFHLTPGPQVGGLLEAVREAQATGVIHNRSEAFSFVEKLLRGEEDGGS